jgi:hypothetical protein
MILPWIGVSLNGSCNVKHDCCGTHAEPPGSSSQKSPVRIGLSGTV